MHSMRILLAHSHYHESSVGGEANVFSAETELLRSHGHEVRVFEKSNSAFLGEGKGIVDLARVASHIYHSPEAEAEIGAVIDDFCPDVLHVHNYMFALTPSVFLAAKKRGVVTVLTLHNYRLLCPSGQFLRNGKVCEWCLDGGGYWKPILSRCYPGGSLVKTIAAVQLHRKTKSDHLLADRVDAYIALTRFAYKKYIAVGISADQVHVKSNFLDDPLAGKKVPEIGKGAVCVGRLSPEKGVDILLRAWQNIDYPLTIIGDGPDRTSLQQIAPPHVSFAGQLSRERVLVEIQRSAFLVFPSLWYEGFPVALLEAMACGRPAVATDLGGRAEVLGDDTGLLCVAGDPESLAAQVGRLISDPELCARLGANARQCFLENFTPGSNYVRLMEIYASAITRSQATGQTENMPAVHTLVHEQENSGSR